MPGPNAPRPRDWFTIRSDDVRKPTVGLIVVATLLVALVVLLVVLGG